jgi:hypothetical protein
VAIERADGWNRWGGDPAEVVARMAVDVAAVEPEPRRARFATSWGGVVDLSTVSTDRLAALLALDVDWIVLGPRAPGRRDDVRRLGDRLTEHRRQ